MRAEAMRILERYKRGPLYNPPVAGDVNGIVGAIVVALVAIAFFILLRSGRRSISG